MLRMRSNVQMSESLLETDNVTATVTNLEIRNLGVGKNEKVEGGSEP